MEIIHCTDVHGYGQYVAVRFFMGASRIQPMIKNIPVIKGYQPNMQFYEDPRVWYKFN